MENARCNKFYKGIVYSPTDFKHPNFKYIIIDTVKELSDEFGEYYVESFQNAEEFLCHDHDLYTTFYGVYAFYWLDIPKGPLRITETLHLEEAINIAQEIMGNNIVDKSNEK